MKIVKPSTTLFGVRYKEALEITEMAGRVCYRSEDKITEGSAEDFIRRLIKRGHESVLEHASVTAKVICDRGVSHQIVRHRIAAYSQESTRYCNYSLEKFGQEITVVEPLFFEPGTKQYDTWRTACKFAEIAYFGLLDAGATAEEARLVLPHSVKTTLVMTYNIRQWRHFFRERTSPAAHPQMREIANMLLEKFQRLYPVFFEDM